jgi:hypothetical protein
MHELAALLRAAAAVSAEGRRMQRKAEGEQFFRALPSTHPEWQGQTPGSNTRSTRNNL